MNMQRLLFLFACTCCLILLGCSGSSSNIPVSGKVVAGGKPFTKGGTVSFIPDKSKGNKNTDVAVGVIEESGDYTLKTKEANGAPPGWYKVAIVSNAPVDSKNPYALPKSYVDARFTSAESTPIVIEVKQDQTAEAYEIKLP